MVRYIHALCMLPDECRRGQLRGRFVGPTMSGLDFGPPALDQYHTHAIIQSPPGFVSAPASPHVSIVHAASRSSYIPCIRSLVGQLRSLATADHINTSDAALVLDLQYAQVFDITFTFTIIIMIKRPQHIYAWLFCGFAALGACIYGYDGVYFNGVSSLVSILPSRADENPADND